MPSRTAQLRCAVGDIHGRFDLLEPLLDQLEDIGREQGGVEIVFLGDYCDRGRQTKQVLDRLISGPRHDCNRFVFVRGNHDLLMQAAILNPRGRSLAGWYQLGGINTMVSYGVQDEDQLFDGKIRSLIPTDHMRFLENLVSHHETDLQIFVHAGLQPDLPLEDQDPDIMCTIRDAFLDAEQDFGKLVVHGHTIEAKRPVVGRFRLGLDTGSEKNDRLTAAIFPPGERLPARFLQAGLKDGSVKIYDVEAISPATLTPAL